MRTGTLAMTRDRAARLVWLSLLILAGLLAAPKGRAADAELPPADAALLAGLRAGGYVIFVRHASTDKDGPGDRDINFALCATQRNLSAAGREESARIGEALRRLRIPIGRVVASPFCRTRDTARLAFGDYEVDKDLYFAIDVNAQERKRVAASLRAMLGAAPARGTNSVIVSHTANLREAAGIWPKPEGAAYVFQPLAGGGFKALARMLPAEWSARAEREPALARR